ncbi:MAG: hypothetical protein J3Q66DRAFT_351506 [Benniella sp.]|nr:MAG: hypothetical protein J3Q66DRAFT_351506 [Benniella sp.]
MEGTWYRRRVVVMALVLKAGRIARRCCSTKLLSRDHEFILLEDPGTQGHGLPLAITLLPYQTDNSTLIFPVVNPSLDKSRFAIMLELSRHAQRVTNEPSALFTYGQGLDQGRRSPDKIAGTPSESIDRQSGFRDLWIEDAEDSPASAETRQMGPLRFSASEYGEEELDEITVGSVRVDQIEERRYDR